MHGDKCCWNGCDDAPVYWISNYQAGGPCCEQHRSAMKDDLEKYDAPASIEPAPTWAAPPKEQA